jgi:hypothetical protein
VTDAEILLARYAWKRLRKKIAARVRRNTPTGALRDDGTPCIDLAEMTAHYREAYPDVVAMWECRYAR